MASDDEMRENPDPNQIESGTKAQEDARVKDFDAKVPKTGPSEASRSAGAKSRPSVSRRTSKKARDLQPAPPEAIAQVLGVSLFAEFQKKRDEDLKRASDLRKMRLMSRHSVRYIETHERCLTNEFERFTEYSEMQQAAEKRRSKLLGLQNYSPAETAKLTNRAALCALRPVSLLERVSPEVKKERRATFVRLLQMQLQRIREIGARSARSRKETPPQPVDDIAGKKSSTRHRYTPRTRSAGEGGEAHYEAHGRRRTAVAGCEDDIDVWLSEFIDPESARSKRTENFAKTPRRDRHREPQTIGKCGERHRSGREELRSPEEQVLEQLCMPSYIAVNPWKGNTDDESAAARFGKYATFRAPSIRPAKHALRVDADFAARWHAKRKGIKSPPSTIPRLGKRQRRHSDVRKAVPRTAPDATLDGTLLLREAGVAEVDKVRYVSLANLGIGHVNPYELQYFTSLHCLDLSGNYVPLKCLAPLASLRKLILQCNQQYYLDISQGTFRALEVLDVSYNLLDEMAVIALSSLPALRKLNMGYNNLEVIPAEAGEMGAFVRLETLCAAGNSLSSMCLLPLSKLPWLETLHLQNNHISGIPDQITCIRRAFSRLATLDLAANPINYYEKLVPLRRMRKLRKVILCDTPLARMVSYDASGRCLPSSVPILQAAIRAQRAGQDWLLEKPEIYNPEEGFYSDKLSHIIRDKKNPPGLFSDERMESVFEKIRHIEEEIHDSVLREAEEQVRAGPTSTSVQVPETMEAEVVMADTRNVAPPTRKMPSPRTTPPLAVLIREELERIKEQPSPAEPLLSEAKAVLKSLKQALRMIPHEGADFEPTSSQKTPRQERQSYQAQTTRQPLVSTWRQTVELAKSLSGLIPVHKEILMNKPGFQCS